MARPRNPKRDQAFQLWKESNGTRLLKDIAEELECSQSLIRKWKNQDSWDEKLNGNVTKPKEKTNGNVTKRPGAPKGSKNAKGNKGGKAPPGNQNAKGNTGGAPKGNRNSVRTGEYESIMFDYMDDTEKELFEQIETDPLYQIELTIRELSIRERRMMHRIMKYENGLTDNQRRVLQQLRKTKDVAPSTNENGVVKYVPIINERLVVTEVEETQLPVIDRILEIEEALTRVTDKRLKAIRQKHDIMKTMSEHELRLRGLDLANRTREAELERITARPVDDSVQITIKRAKKKGDG
ncbi:phage terminase small subunit [Bacillus pumilus]|uniref:phage terminase small subunit n=1 Tax=Bacillus pumilus TaxID=1408 RepID=UPI000DCA328E|nr:phage terminase small subunit [Bacillus pumilus]MBU8608033.1 terminase [Bacillus pumilus]MCW4683448.1 phage terminase small subunit [Bacillus pumilus]MCY7537859.1 phage terminase small subunit [Bacillus pumilus]MEC3593541.1 phage terminase small subunit [Bacillus pumilus]MED1111534.1 phage terminase small subunit [Bacillus pumilus]